MSAWTWNPKETLDATGLGKDERKRSTRVARVIQRELATLLLYRMQDPKLRDVRVSRAEVSDDLKYAKIFFTLPDEKKGVSGAEAALKRAGGFMRSHLAGSLNLRYTPELRFCYDEAVGEVEEMERLLQEIADERNRDGS